jgi:hypothetical protein
MHERAKLSRFCADSRPRLSRGQGPYVMQNSGAKLRYGWKAEIRTEFLRELSGCSGAVGLAVRKS